LGIGSALGGERHCSVNKHQSQHGNAGKADRSARVDILIWAVLSLLAIAAATAIGKRIGVAAPLLLTVAGIGVSLLPFVPAIEIEPEWILAGVLPPLLYSAAVSMPTMEFRRDFTAISGLSILLVVVSAVGLGLLFAWLIPELGLAGGIALGAILSPTDAVGIVMVKRLGGPSRTVALLEGESLLNDASALVLLRAALAGMAATVSLWGVVGDFLYAVAVAALIGWLVGVINLRIRARVEDATVNTVISFAVPFVAAIPAEHLGASGLVAAVVAGMITGRSAARFLSPRHRLSDAQNWRTLELVLEGGVFLVMGLELAAIIEEVDAAQLGIGDALGLAALALFITVLIRALYVAPLLVLLKKQANRHKRLKPAFATWQEHLTRVQASEVPSATVAWRGRQFSLEQVERFQTQLRRQIADIDYFLAEPLGWREGLLVIWAGLRGVVTLAAAQTLPETMPSRALLILIAFVVAVVSLLVQGSTLPWLIRTLKLGATHAHTADAERQQLNQILEQVAINTLEAAGLGAGMQRIRELLAQEGIDKQHKLAQYQQLRLQVIEAQRQVLLDARDDGTFGAAILSTMLENLDADQISLELKGLASLA